MEFRSVTWFGWKLRSTYNWSLDADAQERPAATRPSCLCADHLQPEVFDFLPGDCLITDESSLRDFTEFASSDTSPIWTRITEIYAIEKSAVPSEKLVDIFVEIRSRRNVQ